MGVSKMKSAKQASHSAKTTVEVGQQFPLTIKRLGINGEGVGYYKRHVVFVPGALPGEEVVAKVTNAGERFSEASIKKFVSHHLRGLHHRVQSMINVEAASFSIWNMRQPYVRRQTS